MRSTVANSSAEITSSLANLDWQRLADHFTLSPREVQVITRALQGRRIRQIADELDVAPGTVKTYLSRIRAKLGVKKRQHLTASVLIAALERATQ